MIPSFRLVAIATAGLFFFLTVVWIAAPDRMFESWGVTASPAGYFMAHRAAATFFALGVLAFGARDLEPSPVRDLIARAIVAAFLAVALVGLVEYARGAAGAGMLTAVAVEVVFAAALLLAGRKRAGS